MQVDRFAKHGVERIIHVSDFRAGEWMRRFHHDEYRGEAETISERDVDDVRSWKLQQFVFDELPGLGALSRLTEGAAGKR